MHHYKITVDSSLLGDGPKSKAIATLLRWKAEEKIEILETDPPTVEVGWPGATHKVEVIHGRKESHRGRPRKPLEAPKFKDVATAVYPHSNADKLNRTEINDVMHILRHCAKKSHIFVTTNTKTYIEEGRQAHLKDWFGVIVMTPEQTVEFLVKEKRWE